MFYIVLYFHCSTIKYVKRGRNHLQSAQYHLPQSTLQSGFQLWSNRHCRCSKSGAKLPAECPQLGMPLGKLLHYLVWRRHNHWRYTSAPFCIDGAVSSNAALDRRQFFSPYDQAHLQGRRNNPMADDLQQILGRILRTPYWCQLVYLACPPGVEPGAFGFVVRPLSTRHSL